MSIPDFFDQTVLRGGGMEDFEQADQGDLLDEIAWPVCLTETESAAFGSECVASISVAQTFASPTTNKPPAANVVKRNRDINCLFVDGVTSCLSGN